ncbi:MAG: peptidase U32 family protein, partial [Lentihominibacter sp.]
MEIRKIPELLAPVGGWPQLKAAVQNGADAVYMGGPLFNARIKAENFTWDDMKSAIMYAHDRNVRVYITINTLIKDSELTKAFSYVNFLYGAGADAVILQDIGLARLIKKYLPQMPMHMSTQGTIY